MKAEDGEIRALVPVPDKLNGIMQGLRLVGGLAARKSPGGIRVEVGRGACGVMLSMLLLGA